LNEAGIQKFLSLLVAEKKLNKSPVLIFSLSKIDKLNPAELIYLLSNLLDTLYRVSVKIAIKIVFQRDTEIFLFENTPKLV